MKHSIILLLLLPLISNSQAPVLDSFQKDGRMWYCTESRGLLVRNFYPKDTIYRLFFDNTSKHLNHKESTSTLEDRWFNIPQATIYSVDNNSFKIRVPYPGLFKLKTSRGKTVIKRIIRKTATISTFNLPSAHYLCYFNGDEFAWLERYKIN